MFSATCYIHRRNLLKKRLNKGIALFIGHDESPINFADNCYPFRQDSTFVYFWGHNRPGLTAVMDLDTGDDFLFGQDATLDDLVWSGRSPSLSDMAEAIGLLPSATGSINRLDSFIQKAKKSGRPIHFLPPYRPETCLKLNRWVGFNPDHKRPHPVNARFTALPDTPLNAPYDTPFNIRQTDSHAHTSDSSAPSSSNAGHSPWPSLEMVKAVISQREIKSEDEIKEIEQAVEMSVDMHIAAIQNARPGMLEAEITAQVLHIATKANLRPSFTPIATTRGEILHNHDYSHRLKKGGLFLLDAGCESPMGYAGDLSTTFPIDNRLTTRQKEIYEITLNAHNAALSSLAPGKPFMDIHLCACRHIAEGLKSMGLMKGDVDEAISQGAHALFFPCGTGHMMGLDVHDMEDLGEAYVGYDGIPKNKQFGLKSLRLAKALKPGFVVTIEPGIYFIPALIDQWHGEKRCVDFINYDKVEAYKDFGGIRNEEDVLITDAGYRILGKKKPKTVEEIEALRCQK